MLTTKIDRQQLAAMIEHTFLQAAGDPKALEQLCAEACEHSFGTIIVHPAAIEVCRQYLSNSAKPRIGTVIGFPLGQNTSIVKAYEIQDALARGATEIDMVINVRALQADELNIVRREFAGLVHACRDAGAVSKVILETCFLDDEQKQTACRIALAEGIDFVKTSTGLAALEQRQQMWSDA